MSIAHGPLHENLPIVPPWDEPIEPIDEAVRNNLAQFYAERRSAEIVNIADWRETFRILSPDELTLALDDPSEVFEGFEANRELTIRKAGRRVLRNSVAYEGFYRQEDGIYPSSQIIYYPGAAIGALRSLINRGERAVGGYAFGATRTYPLE